MSTDNMFNVLPDLGGNDEEEDASPEETPPQSTRQGLAGERSPNLRALAAARAAAARRTRQRQGGVSAQEESDGNAAARTRSDADPSVPGQQGLQSAPDAALNADMETDPTSTTPATMPTTTLGELAASMPDLGSAPTTTRKSCRPAGRNVRPLRDGTADAVLADAAY